MPAFSLPVSAQPLPGGPRLRGGEMLPIPDFTRLDRQPFRVGIRPHRRGGVRIQVDGVAMRSRSGSPKYLIHNYGHGGAGITLAWGSADRVREIVVGLIRDDLRREPRRVRIAVVGAGAIGLATAAELKRWRRDMPVRVLARSVRSGRQSGEPNHAATTSWVAGGQFEPSGIWREYQTAARLDELHDLVRRSAARIRGLKRLGTQRQYGIVDRNNYTLQDYAVRNRPLMEAGFDVGCPRDVVAAPRVGTMPFRPLCEVIGREYVTWLINPTLLMPKLAADFRAAGGTFERREVMTEDELRNIDADIIINCTGLGAKNLLGDNAVVPIRGQLVILQNTRNLRYMFSGGCGNDVAYLFARQSDVIVGGTYEVDVDEPVHDEATCRRFLGRISDVFEGRIAPCGLTNPGGCTNRPV